MKRKLLSMLVLLIAAAQGAWAQGEYPIVYDFEAAADAKENPGNKNGSAANGQAFYGWENAETTDSKRQDYKGYEWASDSKLPKVCHVWRRSDHINGNVSGNGGLKCPSNKQMAVDGLTVGSTVTIVYDASGVTDDNKEIVWAIGDGSKESLGHARATATINGATAVPGTTTIASGDVITVNSVTPAENGSGYIVFAIKKGMVIKKITINVVPISLTAQEGKTGEFWATYYNSLVSYTADANTTVYQAAVNSTKTGVVLTEVTGREIPKGKGVVLKSSASTITLTPATTTETLTGNELLGTDADLATPANAYCLSKETTGKARGVGFYNYTSTDGVNGDGVIPANRAYLVVSGGPTTARGFLGFDDNSTTGLNTIDNGQLTIDNEVYDLQGRRVVQPQKGVYVKKGKKVVIK